MYDTLDALVTSALAAPHDKTRRKVLADCIDETDPDGGAVSRALRNDRRGGRVLAAVWHAAQERNIDPNYKLLWAVVTFDLDRVKSPVRESVPVAPLPVPARDEEEDQTVPLVPRDAPWRVPRREPWIPRRRDQFTRLLRAHSEHL